MQKKNVLFAYRNTFETALERYIKKNIICTFSQPCPIYLKTAGIDAIKKMQIWRKNTFDKNTSIEGRS